MRWWQHAFAIPKSADFVPTERERLLIERLRHELERRHLTLPASVLLESFRPLGFVAAQSIWVAYPWFASLFDAAGLKVLGEMLERPGSVDWILAEFSRTPADATAAPPAGAGTAHSGTANH